MGSIAGRLVCRAARRAPDSVSERLREEWLADLGLQRGPIARLLFAIGCCWATKVIAHEHVAMAVPAAGGALGHDDVFTGRTITLVLVATLHVAVLYGLATGLGQRFTKVTVLPLVNRPLDALPRSAPPPQSPRVSVPRIELPPQETPPAIESEPSDAIVAAPPEPPQVALSPPSMPATVNRVQGGPADGFPSTDDFYPDASIRIGEKGAATIRSCVDGRGRLTSAPVIIESTGSSRLDEAALKLARAGSGHYRATTENGQPVSSCYPFRIRFELRN